VWVALVFAFLSSSQTAVVALRFGSINPKYECERQEGSTGNGACNPWMLRRMCDTGISEDKKKEGEATLPKANDDGAFWPSNVENRLDANKVWFGFLGPLSGPDARAETTSMIGLLCGLERVRDDEKILDG
jgi:hypothetical protein